MRWPLARKCSATRRTPSMASPSSSEVSNSAMVPACAGCSAMICSMASTNAATEPFMSAAPRPYSRPSRISGRNGSEVQSAGSPAGTTSVWPSSSVTGAPCPCVTNRFLTAPKSRRWQSHPALASRSAMSSMQPASSGVSERLAINSCVRASTSIMAASSLGEQFLVLGILEAEHHAAVREHQHRAFQQRRVFLQQHQVLGLGARGFLVRQQIAPGGAGLVQQRVETAELFGPGAQLFRRNRMGTVVDEGERTLDAFQPVLRLLAGVAVRQAVQGQAHSTAPRRSSLTEVLLRVFSSTCLTITAQYSEC